MTRNILGALIIFLKLSPAIGAQVYQETKLIQNLPSDLVVACINYNNQGTGYTTPSVDKDKAQLSLDKPCSSQGQSKKGDMEEDDAASKLFAYMQAFSYQNQNMVSNTILHREYGSGTPRIDPLAVRSSSQWQTLKMENGHNGFHICTREIRKEFSARNQDLGTTTHYDCRVRAHLSFLE